MITKNAKRSLNDNLGRLLYFMLLVCAVGAHADAGLTVGDVVHDSDRMAARVVEVGNDGIRYTYAIELTLNTRDATHRIVLDNEPIERDKAGLSVLEAREHAVFVLGNAMRPVASRVLIVVELDSGEVVARFEGNWPSVSPDGRHLAYCNPVVGHGYRAREQWVYIYDFSPGPTAIDDAFAFPGQPVFPVDETTKYTIEGPITWHPDGDRLAFWLRDTADNTSVLAVVDDPTSDDPIVRSRPVPIEKWMYRQDRLSDYFGPRAHVDPLSHFTVENIEWIDTEHVKLDVRYPFRSLMPELTLKLP